MSLSLNSLELAYTVVLVGTVVAAAGLLAYVVRQADSDTADAAAAAEQLRLALGQRDDELAGRIRLEIEEMLSELTRAHRIGEPVVSREGERLRILLDGYWEYQCDATIETLFENDETSRGGRMHIHTEREGGVVAVSADATRLWAIRNEGGRAQRPELRPAKWSDTGRVMITADRVWFHYAAPDVKAQGKIECGWVVYKDRFYLTSGRFEHLREDSKLVVGTVRFRKMKDPLDLEWAPEEIRSAVAAVDIM